MGSVETKKKPKQLKINRTPSRKEEWGSQYKFKGLCFVEGGRRGGRNRRGRERSLREQQKKKNLRWKKTSKDRSAWSKERG